MLCPAWEWWQREEERNRNSCRYVTLSSWKTRYIAIVDVPYWRRRCGAADSYTGNRGSYDSPPSPPPPPSLPFLSAFSHCFHYTNKIFRVKFLVFLTRFHTLFVFEVLNKGFISTERQNVANLQFLFSKHPKEYFTFDFSGPRANKMMRRPVVWGEADEALEEGVQSSWTNKIKDVHLIDAAIHKSNCFLLVCFFVFHLIVTNSSCTLSVPTRIRLQSHSHICTTIKQWKTYTYIEKPLSKKNVFESTEKKGGEHHAATTPDGAERQRKYLLTGESTSRMQAKQWPPWRPSLPVRTHLTTQTTPLVPLVPMIFRPFINNIHLIAGKNAALARPTPSSYQNVEGEKIKRASR